jgi:hypothetical protein
MAVLKVNIKDFMEQHVKPVAATVPLGAGTAAYDGLMALIGGLIDKDISLPIPNVPGPGLADGGVPAISVPAVNPIDPTKALGAIAKAIKEAETTLLGENLAIHNASVDVELMVDVGGVAGASAKFNLQIGPVATD